MPCGIGAVRKHDLTAPAVGGIDDHGRAQIDRQLRAVIGLAGNVTAQFNLGFMYNNGRGVPRDYTKAVSWYRKAAEQGHARAQNNLGVMHQYGHGVPQDYVQAHMWLSLAAAQGVEKAAKNRNVVAKLMTPAEISKARKMAREWMPKKPRSSSIRSGSMTKAPSRVIAEKIIASPVVAGYGTSQFE